MDQVVPWKGLIVLIEPHHPKSEGGRLAYPLLHGEENVVCADAGYTGVEKREEHAGRSVIWQIAARRSTSFRYKQSPTLPRLNIACGSFERLNQALESFSLSELVVQRWSDLCAHVFNLKESKDQDNNPETPYGAYPSSALAISTWGVAA